MPLPPGVKLSDLGLAPNQVQDLAKQGQLSQEDLAGYSLGGAGPLEMGASDVAGINWGDVDRDVQSYLDKDKLLNGGPTEAEQRDAKYGNDMAWMEDIFDQKEPTRERALALGTTGDTAARDKQNKASDELFGLYEQGGRGAQDRAARAEARASSEDWLKGQREADMQNLAERGMSGSGAEIAALLGDRQNAASRLSSADLTASADAEKRALDALLGGTEIQAGIQKGADDYVQKNQQMIADIEGKNVAGRRQGYQTMLNNRNAYDINDIGLGVQAAGQKSSRAALEQQTGYGQGLKTAGVDTAAVNNAQGGYNANRTGTNEAGSNRLAAQGNDVTGAAGGAAAAGAQGLQAVEDLTKKVVSQGAA